MSVGYVIGISVANERDIDILINDFPFQKRHIYIIIYLSCHETSGFTKLRLIIR